MSTPVSPSQVIAEINGRLQSIAELKNKVVFPYDDDDLADKLKGITAFPAAGIVYDGMRSLGDGSAEHSTSRLGISAEMVVTIIVVMQPETLFKADAKTPVIDLMTTIRSAILGVRSITGHKYRFLLEAPAIKKHGLAYWVQRWAIPIQLPPQ